MSLLSFYHLSRFTPRCNDPASPGGLIKRRLGQAPQSRWFTDHNPHDHPLKRRICYLPMGKHPHNKLFPIAWDHACAGRKRCRAAWWDPPRQENLATAPILTTDSGESPSLGVRSRRRWRHEIVNLLAGWRDQQNGNRGGMTASPRMCSSVRSNARRGGPSGAGALP